MPGTKDIFGIYKQHKKQFVKSLAAAKTLDDEAIHQVRVETKKLRSLFRFLDFLSDEGFKQKKTEKLISPVYKSAGKYRTVGLNLKLADELLPEALLAFKHYLEGKRAHAGKKFLKALKKFDKQKHKQLSKKPLSLFKKKSNALVLKGSTAYINGIFSGIQFLFTNPNSGENLHEIRKKLKDAKTIMGLLKELHSRKRQFPSLENIKALEEDIGKWHDKVILAEELENFASGAKDKERLSAVVAKLRSANKRQRMQLTERATNLFPVKFSYRSGVPLK